MLILALTAAAGTQLPPLRRAQRQGARTGARSPCKGRHRCALHDHRWQVGRLGRPERARLCQGARASPRFQPSPGDHRGRRACVRVHCRLDARLTRAHHPRSLARWPRHAMARACARPRSSARPIRCAGTPSRHNSDMPTICVPLSARVIPPAPTPPNIPPSSPHALTTPCCPRHIARVPPDV
jgi:hypothetical protein